MHGENGVEEDSYQPIPMADDSVRGPAAIESEREDSPDKKQTKHLPIDSTPTESQPTLVATSSSKSSLDYIEEENDKPAHSGPASPISVAARAFASTLGRERTDEDGEPFGAS